ncbi:sel1 repeat family protein [Stutzerimonas xanthomarina]|uniref:Sel1 repeat family protein n=1 Tax=Stutzerimonas xanthomarina TaxID=271420 RepID=A0A427DMW9_9GAMM|nr:SEL1-like repeat protein [Stutzerimonas xanthomarina]RRV04701.1 sel1 repeat family protein [Stutzerimonas xanthomarina]
MHATEISTNLRLASLTKDLDSLDERCRSNAFRDMLSLAEEGDSEAMFQVARCLQQGIGVEVDTVVADRWLRRSCVTSPASRLGLYTYGMQHVMQQRPDADPVKGITFLERAASHGYVRAILALVDVVENGRTDLKPDLHRAYRILANSLDNSSDAQLHGAYTRFVERHTPIINLLDS